MNHQDFHQDPEGQKKKARKSLIIDKNWPERVTKTRGNDLLWIRVGQKEPSRPWVYDLVWLRRTRKDLIYIYIYIYIYMLTAPPPMIHVSASKQMDLGRRGGHELATKTPTGPMKTYIISNQAGHLHQQGRKTPEKIMFFKKTGAGSNFQKKIDTIGRPNASRLDFFKKNLNCRIYGSSSQLDPES